MGMIPITRPYLTDAEARAVSEVLASGWVSQGPRVAEFEEAFAAYAGVRYAVATTSCTTALHLALLALGVSEGDEVLVPSFTFVATANAVEYCRARPVFVDVDLATFNLDVAKAESRITPRTRAIVPVHLFGLSADMNAVATFAARHGLAVVEDAACAIGSRYDGRHVGSFGNTAVFSFHPRKIITTGEGGMLTTDDARVAEKARSLRSHAASVSDLDRHARSGFLLPTFADVGFNYRMTDVQAAIGLRQMDKLDEILKRRVALADAYTAALGDLPWLRPPQVPTGSVHAFQAYVTLVELAAPVTRDEIAARLEARGIATRQGTHAVHTLEYYRRRYGLRPEDCPVSWDADRRTLTLPLFPQMTEDDQGAVVAALRDAGRR